MRDDFGKCDRVWDNKQGMIYQTRQDRGRTFREMDNRHNKVTPNGENDATPTNNTITTINNTNATAVSPSPAAPLTTTSAGQTTPSPLRPTPTHARKFSLERKSDLRRTSGFIVVYLAMEVSQCMCAGDDQRLQID